MKNKLNVKIISIFILLILFFNIRAVAQNVAINTTGTATNPSAGLDVDFPNKGLLIPRVPLTASNAAGPIAAPATSLLVYNTATAGASPNQVTPGYYWWDGSKWKRFTDNDFSTTAESTTLFVFASTTRSSITVTTQAGDKVLLTGEYSFNKVTASWCALEFWRGATEIYEGAGYSGATDNFLFIQWVDTPGAGTWTYNLRTSLGAGSYNTYGASINAIILKQ